MVVGINGANGFIGYHLWVHIKYLCDDLSVIKLSKDLSEVDKCDVIVHLAEKNKGYSDELYKNNINSTKSLITSLEVPWIFSVFMSNFLSSRIKKA